MGAKQEFKSIYFPDLKQRDGKSKSFTLAFSENEFDLFNSIKHLSSLEVRKIIGTLTFSDLESRASKEGLPTNRYCIWRIKKELSDSKITQKLNLDPIHMTFRGSKGLPLQSWYPYLEGYSPDFVKHIINEYLDEGVKVIYDPFSGIGTTPLVASELGYSAYYSEVNPLLQILTQTKSKVRNLKNKKGVINLLESIINEFQNKVIEEDENQDLKNAYLNTFSKSKFFPEDTFSYILKTRTFLNKLYFKNILAYELVTVAVLSSLIDNSFLIRRGDLRFRRGKEVDELKNRNYFKSIKDRIKKIVEDIKTIEPAPAPILITEDARRIGNLPSLGIDAVITSPPYLNGTNYFRNTKLELWFLGYLKNSSDLNNFRKLAVTAGINDVSLTTSKTIENSKLKKLLNDLENKAYDKRIPKMVHDYFADMDIIFRNLKGQLNERAVLAVDLGDSIYSGIHVKTDKIFISVLENIGYSFKQEIILRKRKSNNGQELKQVLLIFTSNAKTKTHTKTFQWENRWSYFKKEMPHRFGEMAKRNWGDPIHSLCSFQGKLKPSIANQLVSTFVPERGSMLDIFGGVGTIPLEAALQNKKSFSFDISPAAVAISKAKLNIPSTKKINQILDKLEQWISRIKIEKEELQVNSDFGLNKTLKDYFHPKTLGEIILARKYFKKVGYSSTENALIMSALMHILHGNRPYALSRRSHGITPFAPTGEFQYKNLIEKLREKINRTMVSLNPLCRMKFQPGLVYFQDATKTWPETIKNLDAIITSPPFFDSTRFYSANWMRLWFAGWSPIHFKTEPVNFIDELQKKDLSIYNNIFMQGRERLKPGGVFILHLGKSYKCDMANALAERAKNWFRIYDIFEESVEDGESHGIKDKGSVVKHQYLILI